MSNKEIRELAVKLDEHIQKMRTMIREQKIMERDLILTLCEANAVECLNINWPRVRRTIINQD